MRFIQPLRSHQPGNFAVRSPSIFYLQPRAYGRSFTGKPERKSILKPAEGSLMITKKAWMESEEKYVNLRLEDWSSASGFTRVSYSRRRAMSRTFILLRVKNILLTSNGSVRGVRGHGIGGICEAEPTRRRCQKSRRKYSMAQTSYRLADKIQSRPPNILAITKKPLSTSPSSRRARQTTEHITVSGYGGLDNSRKDTAALYS